MAKNKIDMVRLLKVAIKIEKAKAPTSIGLDNNHIINEDNVLKTFTKLYKKLAICPSQPQLTKTSSI